MARTVAEKGDLAPALGECFREHGFEGATLARISAATGLGKGSLYHFFPGGKDEMLIAVLAEIDSWFETELFAPLRRAEPAIDGVNAMFDAVDRYFRSGRRICLIGALALTDARDRAFEPIRSYFARWIDALANALGRAGVDQPQAAATDVVAHIQGALMLSRALDDAQVFTRALNRLRARYS